MDAETARAPLARALCVAGAVLALDAGSKAVAATQLADRDVALAGPLALDLVYNDTFARGMDLGALTAPATFALTLGFVLLAAVVCTALARVDRRAPLALGLVAGAALANATDFAHTGRGAIDFLAVATAEGAIVFNLADVAAYAGVLLLGGTVLALCQAIAAERRAPAHVPSRVPLHDRVAPRAVVAAERSAARTSRTLVEVARPVPLFAEPGVARRPRERGDVPSRPATPSAPPLYPPIGELPADAPLGFER